LRSKIGNGWPWLSLWVVSGVIPDSVPENKLPSGSLFAKQRFEPGQHGRWQQQHLEKLQNQQLAVSTLAFFECKDLKCLRTRGTSSRTCSERRRKLATLGMKSAKPTNQRSSAHPLACMAPRLAGIDTRRAIDFIYVREILKFLAVA